jgi:HEAT repeat protein
MLRSYAVRALGELGETRDEVIEALLRIAGRDANPEIVKEAVRSLQSLATSDPTVEDALVRAFRRSDDVEVRTRVAEALGDLQSPRIVELAPPLLLPDVDPGIKKRTVTALARIGSDAALSLVLDAARDERVGAFVKGVLEDADRKVVRALLVSRLKSESSPKVLSVAQELLDQIDQSQ